MNIFLLFVTEAHEIRGIYKLFLLSLLRRGGLPKDLRLAKLGRTWRDGSAPARGLREEGARGQRGKRRRRGMDRGYGSNNLGKDKKHSKRIFIKFYFRM